MGRAWPELRVAEGGGGGDRGGCEEGCDHGGHGGHGGGGGGGWVCGGGAQRDLVREQRVVFGMRMNQNVFEWVEHCIGQSG